MRAGRRRRQPQRLLRHRQPATTLGRRHHRADGPDRARRRRPVSTTQIDLGWTASTDNVGVTGYRVERCQGAGCTNFAQVGTPTATTYSDTGLAPSTTYRYRVRAVDAAGNLSAYSSIATATTPAVADTTAPSAPTGLTATAAGQRQVNLTWTASTDNVGGHRLPGRALPGSGLHQLRPGRHADRDHLQRHRRLAPRRRTATGCGRSTRPATSAPTPPSPTATTPAPPADPAGPGRAPGRSTREPAPRPPTPRAVATRARSTGATWTTAGPLRQRAQLQRLDQPGPGRRLGLARSDHGDDAVGLDQADRQPERLADHPPAPDRLLLPQRQQQRRTAAPAGGGTFGTSTTYVSGPTASPVNAWTHVALTYDGATHAAVRQRHPGRHAGDHRHDRGHQQPAVDRRQHRPTASSSPGSSTRSASTTARSPRPTSRPT